MSSADFPEGGIEVADIDDIAASIADLDAIADAVRRSDEDVNPADEAGDRSLQRKAEDEGNQAEGDDSGVPVYEQNWNDDEDNRQYDCQAQNPTEIEPRYRVMES